MRYEMMLPYQIRTAIDENWPVVLPLGVLEYHGEHLAVGMDTLAVTRTVEQLEKEMDKLSTEKWYLESAKEASKELGDKGEKLVLERMRCLLTPNQ